MAGKNYDINFRIKTDASKSRKELSMTVAEFKDFNKTVKASQTPLDRFEKDLSDLNKAFKTGKLRGDQYRHALERIQTRYKGVEKEQKKVASGLSKFSKSLVGFAAGYASISTIESAFRGIADEMQRIDKVGKISTALGVSPEFLSQLDFVAQRTSGLVEGGAVKAIEKMTRRVAEAAMGTGEAIKAIEMLGLEAKALAALSPEQQFKVLSEAMRGVTDEGKRIVIATKLFDDEQAKLHTTMALTNSEMNDQITLAEKLGKVITEEEKKKAAAFNDSKQSFDAAYDSFKKAAFLAAAPELTALMESTAAVVTGDAKTGQKISFVNEMQSLFSGVSAMRAFGLMPERKEMAEAIKERDLSPKDVPNLEIAYDKETKRLLDDMEKGKSEARWAAVTGFFDKQVEKAKETADVLGGGLGHFGLSVAGQFDRAMNAREKSEATFERIVSDPAASITAGSSEAFRLQNQQVSMMKVEKDESKKTAKNTKGTWDATEKVYDLLSNIQEIGL
jgi:hypothetical protein